MSDFRFKHLEQHRTGGEGDRMELSFPLPKSPKGRVQRYCPSTDCTPRVFQLGDRPQDQQITDDDQRLVLRQPGTPGVTCPYCGVNDTDQSFTAPEDIEAAVEQLKWAAGQDIADHFEKIAHNFNRKVANNPFGLSMTVTRSAPLTPYVLREDLLRGLTCDLCGRSYGVYAIALFCPDCGGRNVHVHFNREVELIEKQVKLSEESAARGDDELAYRILGNAHEDVLTALETYLKALFLFLAKLRCDPATLEGLTKKARQGNPFQATARTSELYAQINIDPFRTLSSQDREFLVLHIGKRHVIGHNLGLADDKYSETVGNEKQGVTVPLLGGDVRRFAQLAREIVVKGIEESSPEFLPGGHNVRSTQA